MKNLNWLLLVWAVVCLNLKTAQAAYPDEKLSPGRLCTEDDEYFDKYDYPEQIARCKRHVTKAMKKEIADEYGGIDESDWSDYEFDHLIPLCAGGATDLKNLWPQPIDEAKDKDKVENKVCKGLRDGTMTQKQAVEEVWAWFDEYYGTNFLTLGIKP